MNEEFFKEDLLNPMLDSFLRFEGCRERFLSAVAKYCECDYDLFIERINDINRSSRTSQISRAFLWSEEPGFENPGEFWMNLSSKFDKFATIEHSTDGIKLNPALDAFLLENNIRGRFLHAVVRNAEWREQDIQRRIENINNAGGMAINKAFRWIYEFGIEDFKSLEFWKTVSERYMEFYDEKGIDFIDRYRLQLKPSLDSFLRERGLRKIFIRRVKEYAKSYGYNILNVERQINSTIGGYCIICSIDTGSERYLWEKACMDFNEIEYEVEIN